jgi:hypothetical protein
MLMDLSAGDGGQSLHPPLWTSMQIFHDYTHWQVACNNEAHEEKRQ